MCANVIELARAMTWGPPPHEELEKLFNKRETGAYQQLFLTSLPTELLIQIFKDVDPQDNLSCKLSCRTISNVMERRLAKLVKRQRRKEKPKPNYFGPRATEWPCYCQGIFFGIRGPCHVSRCIRPPERPPPGMCSRQRTIYILARAEKHLLAARGNDKSKETSLQHLVCTDCGRVKPQHDFVDDQTRPLTLDPQRPYIHTLKSSAETRHCIRCARSEYLKQVHVIIGGERRFVCHKCYQGCPLEDRVFLRQGDTKYCIACADEAGLKYTKGKEPETYPFVVYDDMIDFQQLLEDHKDGKI